MTGSAIIASLDMEVADVLTTIIISYEEGVKAVAVECVETVAIKQEKQTDDCRTICGGLIQ